MTSRLWIRMAFVVAMVSVLSLLLTGVVAMRVAGDAATNTALRAKERDAAAVARSVERWVEDREHSLRGWASGFPTAELDPFQREGLTRVVLSAIPSAVVVTLVDGSGQPIVRPAFFPADKAPPGAIAGSFARAERLVDALPVTEALAAPDESAVGAPIFDGSRPTIPIVVVASRSPDILLAAELSLDVVQELEAQSTPDRAVVLLDAVGRPLAGGAHPLLDAAVLKNFLQAVASVSYERDGASVQGGVAPVRGLGWSAVVLEPASIALEGPRRIQTLLPLVVLASSVLALVLGVIWSRSITEPLAQLRDAVHAVAEGRLGVRAPIDRSDEVGELARAFNHMTDRLSLHQAEIGRQQAAIERFNEQLQGEVEAATQELKEAQEQLVRSGQLAAVAQISAGLAHELNNPLTAVLGLAQLLRSRGVQGELADDLANLEAEARRCREVVDALLKVGVEGRSLPGAGSVLSGVMEEVRQAVTGVFNARGVGLDLGDPPGWALSVSGGPLSQALSQLLAALAAGMSPGSQLQLRVSRGEGAIVLGFVPSAPIALEGDDWMASGMDVWLARQTLDRLGATLVEPLEEGAPWQVRLKDEPQRIDLGSKQAN